MTAQEVAQEVDTSVARERALVDALVPADLDLGQWSIEQVRTPVLGAIPVVMRSPTGEAFQVDILAREAGLDGVANTRYFSLFIVNSGNGSTASDELQARGVKVLAFQLARTELNGAPRPELMTFNERRSRYPFGNFDAMG